MLQPHELDSSENDDLMCFWHLASHQPVRTARELFPYRPQSYVTTTKNLGHYAANKAAAQSCRLRGAIDRALVYERICKAIYERLPDYARW